MKLHSRLVLALLASFPTSLFAQPAEITVTTTADSGPGSLRAAMHAADGDGGPTLIRFAPGLAGQTIQVFSPLPGLFEDATTIDGDLDADCLPDVALDGSFSGARGLHLASSHNLLRGLAISGFPHQGVAIDPFGVLGGGSDNRVECSCRHSVGRVRAP